MKIKLYENKYRDDVIFVVLQAKDALGRIPAINADLLDVNANYFEKGTKFFVAVDDNDRVIGCVGYSKALTEGEAFVHRLFVKPAMKHTGIGTALLKVVEEEMIRNGISVSLVHLGEPKTQWFESYSFYPKHGYYEYAPRYMRKDLVKKKLENVYFINGTAYAGKSTLVKNLAEKYNGIACEENYQDRLMDELDSNEFPGLTYTRDLKDWTHFIRRTPDEYEAWINQVNKECTVLEQRIIEGLLNQNKPIFVDTNIPVEKLWEISDKDHVLIMLADPDISVRRFFDRPDREKQFLYQLLLSEPNPESAMSNFRECLNRINSVEKYNEFLNSGFNVIIRDEHRTMEETVSLAEEKLKIKTS